MQALHFARRTFVAVILALTIVELTASLAWPQADTPSSNGLDTTLDVEILPVSGLIDPPVATQLRDLLEQAESEGSDLVVVQIDSDGGVSVDLDELLTFIDSSTIPLVVFVGPLGTAPVAAGAAGLLWLAADVRVVSRSVGQ